tara:strand:+ start:2400 stop:2846 length:447 start_codon:yes stop_codon:yes gene_type:complete
MYQLKQEQWVNAPLKEVWDFFSNPENLLRITPAKMKMRIVEKPSSTMFPGMILRYKVSPILGIPLNWTSEISAVNKEDYFVDEMLAGPFKMWHHLHRFEAKDGGTLISDELHYRLPLESLSRWAHPWLVQKQLKEMFAHREKVIQEIF